MNINQTRKEIIENYIHSYNSFDIEGMLGDLHEDVKFENISNGQVNLSIIKYNFGLFTDKTGVNIYTITKAWDSYGNRYPGKGFHTPQKCRAIF